ncbi:hypothetical protein H4Q26_015509 [Puccinia striiformis f. sp. tritici PST-130]|nr:hypothetical protein H4Q26_015509 [Puccinia striiformis f. sp. tritici PST-130]
MSSCTSGSWWSNNSDALPTSYCNPTTCGLKYPPRVSQSVKNVEPYADEHQLWLPEAELYWFWMREGMWDVLMFKIADFPVSMPFGLGRPYQTPSNGQSQTITLDSLSNHRRTPDDNNAEDHYWPLHFHSMTPCVKQGQHLAFVGTEASMDSGSTYQQHSRSLRTRGSRMLHVVDTTTCCFRRLPRTEILESSYGLHSPMEIVNLRSEYQSSLVTLYRCRFHFV